MQMFVISATSLEQSEAYSDFIFIPVGCFSDPHAFPPTIEIFRDFKLKWLRDDGCIKTKVADEGYIERFHEMIANAERLR